MFPASIMNTVVYFVLLLTITVVKSDESITISLNKTLTVDNKELYGEYKIIKSNSTLKISLTNANKNVAYIILQAHSHIHTITMYQNVDNRTKRVTGINIGLYGIANAPDTYFVLNKNSIDLKLYISVHGYRIDDPIPGGCNMESDVLISPFMHINYTKDMVAVDAPPAQQPGDRNCNNYVDVEFYRMYLNELEFDEDRYFAGLRNMITMAGIRDNGIEVPSTHPRQIQRRFLSAYPGTGSVYVAVARSRSDRSRYSIYVPIYTYACSPSNDCEVYDDNLVSQLFCAGLMFIGLFSCYLGHRFFKTEMFLVGMFAGVIVMYILLSLQTNLEPPALLGASLFTGLFFGGIWILLWWFYGIPVLSVALVTLHLGFMVAAITYHFVPIKYQFFASDGSFWTLYVFLMIGCCLTLTTVSYLSNILCCAILGAYAVVFAMDHYIGSNLKFLVYNVVRRAVVPGFSHAVLALPYQWKEIILTMVWLALAASGFILQHYHNRGRPPFPPPPRSINRMVEPLTYGAIDGTRRFPIQPNGLARPATAADERTPLLVDSD